MPIQSSFQDSGWRIKYQNQISTDKNLNQRNRFPFLERELIMCYHICPDVGPHASLHLHKIRSVLNCSQNAKRKACANSHIKFYWADFYIFRFCLT